MAITKYGKTFALENQQRVDDIPVHKTIREAFVNLIIQADYLLDAGTNRRYRFKPSNIKIKDSSGIGYSYEVYG